MVGEVDELEEDVAAGRLSKCMARPGVSDVQTVTRALRYLKRQPMLGITFSWQPVPVELVVLTDSDWAGC